MQYNTLNTIDTPFSDRKHADKNEALRLAKRDKNELSESLRLFNDSFINSCF